MNENESESENESLLPRLSPPVTRAIDTQSARSGEAAGVEPSYCYQCNSRTGKCKMVQCRLP